MPTRYMLIASSMLVLSACSGTPPALPTSYPADLTQACAPVPQWEGQTSDDAVDYVLNLIDLYGDCSTRHAGLAKAVSQ